MSAVQAASAGIRAVEESNVLLNEAATAIRAAIASIVHAKKQSGETAAQAFAQAAAMASGNSGSRGHVLSNMCVGRGKNIETVQMALVVQLEAITTLLVHGNDIVSKGNTYRADLAR